MTSKVVQTIVKARLRAQFDPLVCEDFRREARRTLSPALARVNLAPDAVALLLAYFGLDDRLRLRSNREIVRMSCLDCPAGNVALCRRLVWALYDPEARLYLEPSFFK